MEVIRSVVRAIEGRILCYCLDSEVMKNI
jgi:hypothetical protein